MVEEVMRYEGPAKTTARIANETVDVQGTTVQAGQRVLLILSSANRDPEVFADPHRFDITRRPNRHLGFGTGAHACFGAALARLQAQIAIPQLFLRFPRLDADLTALRWKQSRVLRSLEQLPVGGLPV
jgi:pimeloyl-[acyl-carrier protein] synthase